MCLLSLAMVLYMISTYKGGKWNKLGLVYFSPMSLPLLFQRKMKTKYLIRRLNYVLMFLWAMFIFDDSYVYYVVFLCCLGCTTEAVISYVVVTHSFLQTI